MTKARAIKQTKSVLYQAFAIFLGCVIILPIIYALLISFMPANQILRRPPTFIPKTWILDNYRMAISATTLGRFMINSLIIAGVSSIIRVITSAMAAYAFVFFNFKFKNIIFMIFLGTIMVPSDIVLVTNYRTVANLGLINTYTGMMIIFFCSATNIFMMRQYFMTFSTSIKEASTIDGCGNFRFFIQILLPLSMPVMTTIFISSFISTWNTYLWPMLVTNQNNMRTVQVGVTMMNFPDGVVYGPIMAASILVLLPTLLIFVIFQKKIVGGIMGGAVKE
ncbi:carbohydrate ABC transporter permease [Breznakiella homolactica]|uniref:sn-glycerol-3-phosphate transport system permease protein UgpE n=1 Tax=Breznakiella homolactica TaxID=2798577 RepID=A0A7T7XL84_9SPIR|nr:carbohydrate ABC transporter permease [Breznakiella homolactica]QQO08454.1 carbohydrate ABC transporter permease [Breznakiella homolactica]